MAEEKKCVIVVVDDEETMADYVEELLGSYGYEHHSFIDPAKALEFFSRNADRVDLIISDVKMPGIDGAALVRRAAQVRADIPAILLSGFSETLPEVASISNVKAVLEKPLVKTDLLQAVRDVLSGCRAAKADGAAGR
jgi:CheY-like chemotaxis protein